MYNHTDKKGNVKRELDILLSKTLSMFRYEGLPDSIPQRELERQLQMKGYAFVTKFEGKLYSFTDGLGGEPDPYGNPTKITIANPALKYNATLDLEKDGVLIRSDSMMNGLRYLLEKYATLMNESDVTMMVNSFTARMPAMISAGDDKTRESAEQYLQRIINGEMGIIAENRLFEGIKVQATGGNGSVFTQLIEHQQYLKATLYNELGLEMNNNMKRERLTEDEVNMTDIVYPFIDNMFTNRESAVEKINKMFGTEITVGFDSVWAKHAPSDAWDDEQFYEELDEYLELLLGQEEEPQPTEAPVEEVEEDVLPGVSEEELMDILEQLKLLSEEDEDGNRESSTVDGNSGDSITVDDEELANATESGGDTESVEGHQGDDNEPAEHHTEESDGADGQHEETDAGRPADGHDSSGSASESEDDGLSREIDDSTDSGTDSGTDDGRPSVGDAQTNTTHVELTISNGGTDSEDSGAHSEAELREGTGTRTDDESSESGETIGTGSDDTEHGGVEPNLLEGAEPDVEVEAAPEVDEDGLQTVEVEIEMQTPEAEEQLSVDISVELEADDVEEEESEDES